MVEVNDAGAEWSTFSIIFFWWTMDVKPALTAALRETLIEYLDPETTLNASSPSSLSLSSLALSDSKVYEP